jgi:hypothetical protein
MVSNKKSPASGYPHAIVSLHMEKIRILTGHTVFARPFAMFANSRIVYILRIIEIIATNHFHVLYFDYFRPTISIHTSKCPVTWPI